MNILYLNDDCIEELLYYLDLQDQISFARICPRFRAILQIWSRVHRRVVLFSQHGQLSCSDFIFIFDLIGPTIKTVSVWETPYQNPSDDLVIIAKFCKNIENLWIYVEHNTYDMLGPIIEQMQSLRGLHLRTKDIRSIQFNTLQLHTLPNLKMISIDCYMFFMDRIEKLNTVEEIYLKCVYLSEKGFIDICRKFTNLKTLRVNNVIGGLSTFIIQRMTKYCKNLKHFSLNCNQLTRCELVARLPKLETLSIQPIGTFHTIREEQLLKNLVKYKSQQLKYFRVMCHVLLPKSFEYLGNLTALREIYCVGNVDDNCLQALHGLCNLELFVGWQSIITNKGLLRLLEHCKKLRVINVEGCVLITNNFILETIEILKKQRKTPESRPLVLCLHHTNVTKAVFRNPNYLASKKLLKVYLRCVDWFTYSMSNFSVDQLISKESVNFEHNVGRPFAANIYKDIENLY